MVRKDKGMEKARILLVDDDVGHRRCLRILLENGGYTCTGAENGSAALEQMRGTSINLIITDNQMPIMDGLRFIETLQKKSNHNSIPVILVTGDLTELVQSRASKAGVETIFSKPYNYDHLFEVVEEIIKKRHVVCQD